MPSEARIRRKLERIREHRRKTEERKAAVVLEIGKHRVSVNITPIKEA